MVQCATPISRHFPSFHCLPILHTLSLSIYLSLTNTHKQHRLCLSLSLSHTYAVLLLDLLSLSQHPEWETERDRHQHRSQHTTKWNIQASREDSTPIPHTAYVSYRGILHSEYTWVPTHNCCIYTLFNPHTHKHIYIDITHIYTLYTTYKTT